MKKFLALLLALTLALSLAVPAYAADTTEEDDLDWPPRAQKRRPRAPSL